MSNENNTGSGLAQLVYIVLAIATAIIGYEIHGSIFWAIIDWIFWPIAWLKWLLCQEVNITIIKAAFDFFLK